MVISVALSFGAEAPPPAAKAGPPLPENAGITMAYYRNFFSGSMNHLCQLVEDKVDPSGTVVLENFEARDWWTQKNATELSRLYALNLYGFIVPDSDGEYLFYAHVRGQMRFLLSTDDRETNAVPLKFTDTDVDRKDENVPFNRVSAPVKLEEGKSYFVRVLFIPGWHERLNVQWVRKDAGPAEMKPELITARHLRLNNQSEDR
jgi:hypothetical protein